jgi:hypothetical protein
MLFVLCSAAFSESYEEDTGAEPRDCSDAEQQVSGGRMIDSLCVAPLESRCGDCGTWESSVSAPDGLLVDCVGSGQHLAWRPDFLGSGYEIWVYDGDEVNGVEAHNNARCCEGYLVDSVFYGGRVRHSCTVPIVADAPADWTREPECSVTPEATSETARGGCSSAGGEPGLELRWTVLFLAGLVVRRKR